METFVVVGASRGIGAAMVEALAEPGRRIIGVSRSPAFGECEGVRADLTTDEGIDAVVRAVGDGRLDALFFLGGTWEAGAFTNDYDFLRSPRAETRGVIATNLVAPILLAQALAPSLARAANGRIVLIGALSGRDGAATVEVANTASKFGLRGAAQALEKALVPLGIAVTVVNPGNVATDEVLADLAAGRMDGPAPIPLADLAATLSAVLSLSRDAGIREIDIAQRLRSVRAHG